MLNSYDVIATLGPASSNENLWAEMLACGVTGFRLNTSHLSIDDVLEWLKRIDRFFHIQGNNCRVILDLQGSKWRLGSIKASHLGADSFVRLLFMAETREEGIIPVPHRDFFQAVLQSNGEIVLNDGKVILIVEKASEDEILAKVAQGGEISSAKGITCRNSEFHVQNLRGKDGDIFTATQGFSYLQYAISYIRDHIEMNFYRKSFGPGYTLIAKLERLSAMQDAMAIANCADELWVCRGDLGAEAGFAGMAASVHQFTKTISDIPKPVLLAGQVLEHMRKERTPTRSEVCYLYDALQSGFGGVVLSDETAVGENVIHACKVAGMFKHSGDGGN